MREVLATEMLEALGVATSKSLSLFETGDELTRGDVQSPTRSSVIVRLSHSHIRIGTFQRLAHLDDAQGLDRLLAYSIAEYYPHLAEEPDRATAFAVQVARAAASQCAGTMVAGFVHGVLNSDNMTITGESFDYGPLPVSPSLRSSLLRRRVLRPRGTLRVRPPAAGHAPQRLAPRGSASPHRTARRRGVGRGGVQGPTAAGDDTPRRTTSGLVPRLDVDAALVDAVYAFLDANGIGYDRFFFDLHGGLEREPFAPSPAPRRPTIAARRGTPCARLSAST